MKFNWDSKCPDGEDIRDYLRKWCKEYENIWESDYIISKLISED